MENESSVTKQDKKGGWLREIINFALIAVFIVLPFRLFIAEPFIVSGESMDPTFGNGEYLIVDQLSYRFETPKRESVVIFKYPRDPSKYFIKRIIGLPGETLNVRDGEVFIKSKNSPGEIKLSEPYLKFFKNDNFQVTLAADEYFVLGDNRPRSSDSRFWGPLQKKLIVGRPILRLLPITAISLFPGDYSGQTAQ